ncbi:MAG TPA: sulfatase/phosphatase domain-containing protein, partial [Candidatus Polarisedimenticolia bacterium]|nr:sulfatase/phosphatase domain-containing protein [Candidatus Polarisedimenticolia bacterium]
IGDLLRGVEALGATARTVVVVTADHGESLGEHDYFFEHGAYLYEATVRVPLILSDPALLPAGGVVEEQARTVDIMPTILALAGVAVPGGLDGVSLVPRLRGDRSGPGLLAYSESGRNFYRENPRQYIGGVAGKWRMLRSDAFKLILIPKDPEPIWELYDLRADPGETVNVLRRFPEVAADLKSRLLAILAADPGRSDRDEPPLPPELQEQMRSLGYVGSGRSR